MEIQENVRLEKELQIANLEIPRLEAKITAMDRQLELKIEHEKKLVEEVVKANSKILAAKTVIRSCLKSFRVSTETKNWVNNILAMLEGTEVQKLENKSTKIDGKAGLSTISEENSKVQRAPQSKIAVKVVTVRKNDSSANIRQEKLSSDDSISTSAPSVAPKGNNAADKQCQRRKSIRKSIKLLNSNASALHGTQNSNGEVSHCPHSWYLKTVIRPEICKPCGKRIQFSKAAFKCIDCQAAAHPDCKDKVSLMIAINPNDGLSNTVQMTPKGKSKQKETTESSHHEALSPLPVPQTPKVRGTLHYFSTPLKDGKSVLRVRKSRVSKDGFTVDRPIVRPLKYFDFD